LISKFDVALIDDPEVSSVAIALEAETSWYPSTLSAMLCQQGFLFDSLCQHDNAQLCFAAASRMVPFHECISSENVHEPLLKIVLRKLSLASRAGSTLHSIPDTFEDVPGLKISFIEFSLNNFTASESDESAYMNITGWLAFCAKVRFQKHFPLLTRSKCITCFMESAKKSYGSTLLLSFDDFCKCLLLLKEAGIFRNTTQMSAQKSGAADVAEIVAFLQAVEFFTRAKTHVQQKHQKKHLLTASVELPILKSVFENESETWSLNSFEIMVKDDEKEYLQDNNENPIQLVVFRAPFCFVRSVEDESLSSHVSNALSLLTTQVASIAHACSSLKLNRPALAQKICSHLFHVMGNLPKSKLMFSDRIVQIVSIARIQEALCFSDANKAKVFFSLYQYEMRESSINSRILQKCTKRERSLKMEQEPRCNHEAPVLTTCAKFGSDEHGLVQSQRFLSGNTVDTFNKSANDNTKGKLRAVMQPLESIPELPAEIIRLFFRFF
jgi:hypothetical protein